jgi:arginase family enzyme
MLIIRGAYRFRSAATPTWGGASARKGLRLIEGLRGLDIVAADINTISPTHDAVQCLSRSQTVDWSAATCLQMRRDMMIAVDGA